MIKVTVHFDKTPIDLRLLDVSGDNEYSGASGNLRPYNGSMSFAVLGDLPQDMYAIFDTLSHEISNGFQGLTVGITPKIDRWSVRYTLDENEQSEGVTCILTVTFRSLVGGNVRG